MPNQTADRLAASTWARNLLANPESFCVLDSETSGLLNHGAVEVLQIGILHGDGTTALDSLVRPDWRFTGMSGIPAESTAIHGITDEMVADAPTLLDLLPQMAEILHGKQVIVYNVAYDFEVLLHCLYRRYKAEGSDPYQYATTVYLHDAESNDPARVKAYQWLNSVDSWDCAMEKYAAWWGDWNEYRGSYRWQKLVGGDHSAVGDCVACLDAIRRVAGE